MYFDGTGVLKDAKEAVNWYRKAAEQGHAIAQWQLGFIYANSEGVLKDAKEAVNWHRKAAEQGIASAQFNLGAMYANGQGVPKDMVNAYAWLNMAVANCDSNVAEDHSAMIPNTDLVKARDLVAKEMTPEQIAETRKLLMVWFEKFQPKN